ncbi:MAG: septum formation initiator family protein [Bacteroidales bacterium]|jgi:cell division protein FtsB|nr:septum formation initiator family protein [Bacteroidales bacterium]HOL98370.1 septum formation initiator family protein [Bacteroidales bacterium]HOM36785.1 septum formation initiator family protein [Bacteroidales bacterium]HPD24631.1 septum formation initiator family protein [Bacteroidales bacterium]HRS99539.1 septum formation initiator family protein [Bacteroidales bacterium]
MKKIFEKIKSIFLFIIKNKYIVTFTAFLVWILFLDTYNIYDRIKKLQKLHELKKETEFFKKEIEIYNQQYQELFSDEESLEKFAREQYQLKEEDEDVFIIISD